MKRRGEKIKRGESEKKKRGTCGCNTSHVHADKNQRHKDSQVLSAKIPSCIASGEYLVRVEHIGLHGAATEGGAQFYVACAQVSVSGGGSTIPTGLVSFPGAYKSTDPGILFQLYWPTPTSYTNPGPAPFTC